MYVAFFLVCFDVQNLWQRDEPAATLMISKALLLFAVSDKQKLVSGCPREACIHPIIGPWLAIPNWSCAVNGYGGLVALYRHGLAELTVFRTAVPY